MLSIHLFGTPEVKIDRQPIRLARRKSRALLYYLAAHQQPLSRENLLANFWPDTPRPAAQQILRTTLHSLRQALGPALLTEAETVALSPDTWVDARPSDTWPNLWRSDRWARRWIYRGIYWPISACPTCRPSDWALVERNATGGW
jgi:hypothetical protein